MARGVRSICLMLGPYRNLTTLTASILALHPHCQVLNHAGDRILADPHRNPFLDFGPERLDAFARHALEASAGGRRGQPGGSITLSHAFDEGHPVRALYRRRYGTLRVKSRVDCLVWKESLRTANALRASGLDLGAMLAADPRLRFLMPVRNPLDCAVSNQRSGHTRHFLHLGHAPGLEDVLVAILDELRWFVRLAAAHPGRFLSLFAHAVSDARLASLAGFLDVAPEAWWKRDALEAFRVGGRYEHAESLVRFYERSVDQRFAAFPGTRAQLLAFVRERSRGGELA